MSLVDALIAQGMKNNAEFTQQLIEIKKRVENTKDRQALTELKEVTGIMQNVDDFTLYESQVGKEEREQMKSVDVFTLDEVQELKKRVEVLENGGTA
jgi:hypothetical protein